MSLFKKPRYKSYLRLTLDSCDNFRSRKFNRLKWKAFKLKWKTTRKTFLFHDAYQMKKKPSLTAVFGNQRLKHRFKETLLTKQRLASFYALKDFQLKKVLKPQRRPSHQFLRQLEHRLDTVVYRSRLVPTFFYSRQLIRHNHVRVNRCVQSQPSFHVSTGDLIEVRPTLRSLQFFIKRRHQSRLVCRTAIGHSEGVWSLKWGGQTTLPLRRGRKTFCPQTPFYLPSHLETNFKTLSTVVVGRSDLKKSFKFWLNTRTLIEYYKTH